MLLENCVSLTMLPCGSMVTGNDANDRSMFLNMGDTTISTPMINGSEVGGGEKNTCGQQDLVQFVTNNG